MTLWRWYDAEYHTHEGWVPMIDVSIFDTDAPPATTQVREDVVVAYDTSMRRKRATERLPVGMQRRQGGYRSRRQGDRGGAPVDVALPRALLERFARRWRGERREPDCAVA